MIYYAPAIYKCCPVCGQAQTTSNDELAGPKMIKTSDFKRVIIAVGAGSEMLVCCVGCLPGVVVKVLSRGSQHWGPK